MITSSGQESGGLPILRPIASHSSSVMWGVPPPPADGGIAPAVAPTSDAPSDSVARARAPPRSCSESTSRASGPSSFSVSTHTRTSTPSTFTSSTRPPLRAAYSSIRARTSGWSIAVMSVVPYMAHWTWSWRLISRAPASAAASAAVCACERRMAALPIWNPITASARIASRSITSPGRICPSSRAAPPPCLMVRRP